MNDLSHAFSLRASSLGKSAHGYLLVILGQPEPDEIGFELSSARLSVGAGENDDVYVSDVGVVPGHVDMIFLDGHVTVLSAAETIYIDGQVVTKFPFDWPPLSTLSFGPDTHLAYGEKGANWPAAPEWDAPTDTAGEDLTESESVDLLDYAVDPMDDHAGEFHLPFLSPRARAIHSARMTAWALAAATVIVIVFVILIIIIIIISIIISIIFGT